MGRKKKTKQPIIYSYVARDDEIIPYVAFFSLESMYRVLVIGDYDISAESLNVLVYGEDYDL